MRDGAVGFKGEDGDEEVGKEKRMETDRKRREERKVWMELRREEEDEGGGRGNRGCILDGTRTIEIE